MSGMLDWMNIENSTNNDITEIMQLYEIAINFQKAKGAVPWQGLTRSMIVKEINEKMQWKLIIDNSIACVFVTTFTDPHIWGEKNREPSIYIHRIATDSSFRVRSLVSEIVEWGRGFAKKNNKKFIRLDTAGENQKLIEYYQSCGFSFLGSQKLINTEGLPQHYKNVPVCLFELAIDLQ